MILEDYPSIQNVKKKNEVFYKNSGYFEDAIDAKIIYQDEEKDESTKKESQLYEHIKDATSTHDAQVIDVATEIQQVEQAMPDSGADQESGEVEDDSDDVEMKEEEVKQRLNIAHIQEIARVFLGYFVMHYWL